jgi:hypothetical protein
MVLPTLAALLFKPKLIRRLLGSMKKLLILKILPETLFSCSGFQIATYDSKNGSDVDNENKLP